MERFLLFLLTLLVAAAGGFVGKKLKFPAGLLVGAMVFTSAFNVITGKGEFYTVVRVMLQVLSGALVGSRIGPNELKNMKSLIWSVVALVVSMMLLNISFAFLILLFSDLNPATALFATAGSKRFYSAMAWRTKPPARSSRALASWASQPARIMVMAVLG